MKKLIYLIPVLFLIACSGTREVYDDVYAPVKKQEKVIENDDLGYADYVKNSESEYKVEVEERTPNPNAGRTIIPNSGYSTQSGDIVINNYEQGSNSYYGADYYYNDPFYSNGWGNWGGCRYNCSFFFNYGNCCHVRAYRPYYNSWNWGFGYGYSNWYGCGNYWNYGSPYWQPNGWYVGNYYGYSFHPHYGWGYWGFWGIDPLNSFSYYTPNNSFAWTGSDAVGNSNHHYGHRGSVNAESSNTTAYEHTVKSHVVTGSDQPFTEYVADQSIAGSNYVTSLNNNKKKEGIANSVTSQPASSIKGGGITGIDQNPGVIYNKPPGSGTANNNISNNGVGTTENPSGTGQIEPGTINTSLWDKPKTSGFNNTNVSQAEPNIIYGSGNNGNAQVSNVQTKPATNKFSSGSSVSNPNSGNPNGNTYQNSSAQKYQTYNGYGSTYSGNNQYNTSNNGNYIQNNTYNNQNNQGSYTPNYTTTTNRTNSSNRSSTYSNSSNRGSNVYNNRSGSSNRSSSSSRSSSSRSSSSRSSGSGSGSGSSGSSRRR